MRAVIETEGLTHIHLVVRDLDRSLAFYHDVFGVEEMPTLCVASLVRWSRCSVIAKRRSAASGAPIAASDIRATSMPHA